MSKLEIRTKKKTKKGFTMVELVVVIALLTILAAIAIPVITTLVNSSKLSVIESDTTTVDMVIKEAITTSKVGLTTTYNGKSPSAATVEDVLIENGVNLSVMSVREIDGIKYAIYWDKSDGQAKLRSGTTLSEYDITKRIATIG